MRREAPFRALGATAFALSVLGLLERAAADAPSSSGGSTAKKTAAEMDEKPASTAEAGFDNVEMLDDRLNGKLSVVSVGSDRTNTNLLSTFATLKNLTSSSLVIEAETLYKDGNGNWLDGGKASWLQLELKPHEEMEYRSASLSDDAQDFLVRIRRPAARP